MALRCCDFDAKGGPLEAHEEDWDGASVWLGQLPSHAVCRASGAEEAAARPGTQAGKRGSAELFAQELLLTDELRNHLDTFGEGLGPPLPTVYQRPDGAAWALLTFQRREDAEALLQAGIGGWEGGEPEGAPAEAPLLRRSIPAEQAHDELAEAEARQRARRETAELAVTRIYGWLKKEGASLQDLFTKIDKDGSGAFDQDEFRAGMLEIGLTFDDNTIGAVFSFMDESEGFFDGEVDTGEFISAMESFNASQQVSATACWRSFSLGCVFTRTALCCRSRRHRSSSRCASTWTRRRRA